MKCGKLYLDLLKDSFALFSLQYEYVDIGQCIWNTFGYLLYDIYT